MSYIEYDPMENYDQYVRAGDIYCDFLDVAIEIRFPKLMVRVKNELPDPGVDWQIKSDLWSEKLEAGEILKLDGTFDPTAMEILSWGLAVQDKETTQKAISEYRQSLTSRG